MSTRRGLKSELSTSSKELFFLLERFADRFSAA